MTTTLRPTGPLQQADDGTLTRSYEVCVNSRPVGAVELGTVPGLGRTAGVIRSLRIDEADRRRGRGTVAALAAEEVLRGWGCARIQVSVPADASVALRLAAALGYTERGRNMSKDLVGSREQDELREAPGTGGSVLPAGLSVRPMTEDEFHGWYAAATEDFARQWVARGLSEEEARAKSETSHRQLLPDGLATGGTRFHVAVRDGAIVGQVWTGPAPDGAEHGAYVWDVAVAAEERGKGYGRALMLFAERVARDSGAHRLGLHVFADNTPALRLYESLGYRTTHINSHKPLL
ncbi:GNAT family N-acetyltransferase [Streptomyces sp. NPDC047928]|uniref:GNAT family N-acetyltransferase n=1 Tax=unclassified Streptomyces TaxID=2593676 RepID=UPI0037195372